MLPTGLPCIVSFMKLYSNSPLSTGPLYNNSLSQVVNPLAIMRPAVIIICVLAIASGGQARRGRRPGGRRTTPATDATTAAAAAAATTVTTDSAVDDTTTKGLKICVLTPIG